MTSHSSEEDDTGYFQPRGEYAEDLLEDEDELEG